MNTPKKLVDSLQTVQIKFFKMLSERAGLIGVRGEFTAECLSLMGAHNVQSVGCPSFYKYFDGFYPEVAAPSIRGVQMTFTPGTIERSKILKLGMSNECFWIVQEMGEYPKTINVLGKECVSYK